MLENAIGGLKGSPSLRRQMNDQAVVVLRDQILKSLFFILEFRFDFLE